MLVADGGGGYGGTDWMGMDVIQMWQAVENQDTTAHYQLLTGWRKSYELTLEHLSQVQNYRQSLAEAWPPETSAASAAYIQRLDDLITNLQATYDAAVANHDAFANATLAISMSRDDVKKIYDEYTANQAKLAEFKNQQRPVSKFPVPPQKPPVADGRQEQLNNQARTVMFGLSGEILQAKSQIVKPVLYDPDRPRLDSKVPDNSTIVAPMVPPVGTYDPTSSSSGSPSSASDNTPNAPTNPGSGLGSSKPTEQSGLVLGGADPASNAPVITRPGPASLSPPGGGAASGIMPTTGILPLAPGAPISRGISSAVGVTEGVPRSTYANRGITGGGLIRSEAGSTAPSEMRVMPPGAVIGGSQGPGQRQIGSRTRAPSRVNPIGGVINGRSTEGASGSMGRPTGSQPLGVVPGRVDRRDNDGKARHWDPDNPWETEEGVPPVLQPSKPQRIDPGPAIGLH